MYDEEIGWITTEPDTSQMILINQSQAFAAIQSVYKNPNFQQVGDTRSKYTEIFAQLSFPPELVRRPL